MRKIFRLLLVLSMILFTSCGKQVIEYEARQALYNNLIARYGEEFEIGYMGRRSDGKEIWYEAEIYPSKYNGTPKENDDYYKSHGNVNIEKGIFGEKIGYVGDLYRVVLFNESANEFYLAKLKELFGENVLPVLEIDSSRVSKNPEFLSNPKFLPEYKKRLEDGSLPFLKGGIYIFGRVENDEDREWYRKQIYEFVQFMKQTGTFEYVSLNVAVVDERILSEEYQNNSEFIKKLIQKAETNNMEWQEYRDFRRELYGKNFPKNYTLKTNLNDINKAKILEHVGEWSNYNALLYIKIYSPKYLESNSALKKEKRLYNKVEDIKFGYETW